MTNKEAIEHLKNINSRYPCSLETTFRDECEMIAINLAIKSLEERPQGEWEYNQYDGNPNIGNWHCSICHTICCEMKLAHDNFNYCPNCGAKMKGGAE